MMIYIQLFLGFLKVGLFAFGGAYGAIPLIREVVLSYGWLDDEMLTIMIAVSESTPGPIIVNLATYVGSSQAGLPGAGVATLAVILPAFVIILIFMIILKTALKNNYVNIVMDGLKPCIIGIILATGCYMIVDNCIADLSQAAVHGKTLILTGILGIVYFGSRKVMKNGISPLMFIFVSACLGVVVYANGLS